jgi:hypothetical protein
MEAYDISKSLDEFSYARELFFRIIETLKSDKMMRAEHGEVEQEIMEQGFELMRRLLQGHLDRRSEKELQDGTTYPPTVAQPFLGPPGCALQSLAAEVRTASFSRSLLDKLVEQSSRSPGLFPKHRQHIPDVQPFRSLREPEVRPMTRPIAVRGALHQPRANRIVVHVSNQLEQVLLLVHQYRLVAIAEHRSLTLPLSVQPDGKSGVNRFGQPGQIVFTGSNDQVGMTGHQAPSEHNGVGAFRGVFEKPQGSVGARLPL